MSAIPAPRPGINKNIFRVNKTFSSYSESVVHEVVRTHIVYVQVAPFKDSPDKGNRDAWHLEIWKDRSCQV